MAEKKFQGIEGIVTGPEVQADYEAAQRFDKVRVGRLGAYYREGFKVRFMDYSLLDQVFIRIQEVNQRVCCGNISSCYYKLVFVRGGEEIGEAFSESEKAMDQALEQIGQMAPGLKLVLDKKE